MSTGTGSHLSSIKLKEPPTKISIPSSVGYRDAKDVDDSDVKFHRWNVAAGYTYAFSKRTSVYGLVGYAQEKAKGASYKKLNSNPNPNEVQAGIGLVHKF